MFDSNRVKIPNPPCIVYLERMYPQIKIGSVVKIAWSAYYLYIFQMGSVTHHPFLVYVNLYLIVAYRDELTVT